MKNKYSFLFCVLATVSTGCSKEPSEQPQSQTEESFFEKSPPIRKVLYINSSQDIIDKPAREDSAFKFCNVHAFKIINLSGSSKVLNKGSVGRAQMNAFVIRARNHGLKINFVVGSTRGVEDIKTYCANYPNNLPDGIVTEYEFWNPPQRYDTAKAIIAAMKRLHDIYPSISRYVYVNLFRDASDATIKDSTIIKYLIENTESMFLANYYREAYHLQDKFKKKLQQVTDEATRIHKVANIIILFKVNRSPGGPDIFSYFSKPPGQNHRFVDAYTKLMAEYDEKVNMDDDGMSFKGYAIFHYSEAIKARPLSH
jgi:AAA15 family ATPase/GTPase